MRYILNVPLVCFFLSLFFITGCNGRVEDDEGEQRTITNEEARNIYRAVPNDVLAIFDFENLKSISDLVTDTTFVGYGLFDPSSPLLHLYKELIGMHHAREVHTLYALQYSGRNEISFLQILDFSSDSLSLNSVVTRLDSIPHKVVKYNNVLLKRYSNGLNVAIREKYLLASSSPISIESSIRHLANGSSILNNQEFSSILGEQQGRQMLYVNHRQIGKVFSGTVTRPFLKYADFANRYGTWSVLRINSKQRNFVSFEGESVHHGDAINFSSALLALSPNESQADEFLPASTVFAFAVRTQGAKSYLKSYRKYLDANKKLNSHDAQASRISLPGDKSPEEWFIQENYSEVISAFCLVGGKYEWLTFTVYPSSGWFRRLLGIKKREPQPVVEEFNRKGYIAAVLGEAFSHTNEEYICKFGSWSVIGSQRAIAEFEQGRANAITLKRYLSRTPASSLFSNSYSLRVWANISDGQDTLLSVLNGYYRKRITSSLKVKNFEYATLGVRGASGSAVSTLNFYASNLSTPPQMFPDGSEEELFFVDSTIKVSFATHTLCDPLSGDTLYFQQSKKYLSIFLDNNKHKTLWGIPMRDTLRSLADFVVLGSRSYIAFAMGSKLYLISQKGAFANGYPKDMGRKIALGPKVIMEEGEYRVMLLDSANIISKHNLDGEIVAGWKDIHAPEFTHNLPDVVELFGREYLILRTVFRTRIYTKEGVEIEIKDKKRAIAKDSPITEHEDGYIRVMGLDGNEFLVNLSNGKTKKL